MRIKFDTISREMFNLKFALKSFSICLILLETKLFSKCIINSKTKQGCHERGAVNLKPHDQALSSQDQFKSIFDTQLN